MSIGGIGSTPTYPTYNLGDAAPSDDDIINALIAYIRDPNGGGGSVPSNFSDDQLKGLIKSLLGHIQSIMDNIHSQYDQIQRDYQQAVANALANKDTKAVTQAGIDAETRLKALFSAPGSGLIDQVNTAITETLRNNMKNPPGPGNDILKKLQLIITSKGGQLGKDLNTLLNFQDKIVDPTTKWPLVPPTPPTPPPTPPTPPPTPPPKPPTPPTPPVDNKGAVPFTITVPPGQDIHNLYVRVQGIDPNTGEDCFITWDKQGNPLYHDFDNIYTANPADYCVNLADLPHTGNTVEINLPKMTSGRMFFSAQPLQTLNPDPQNTGSKDYAAKWSMIEFTNNGSEIYADTSAVDTFSVPSIQMQMSNDHGTGPQVGYGGDPREFMQNFQRFLALYGGSMASIWGAENFSVGGTAADDFIRVMSPKHFPDTFKSLFSDYIKNTFLNYYKDHPLYLQASVGGKMESLRGQVSDDGKTFNFYDRAGNLVTTLPTNGDNSIAWLTGATGDWSPKEYTSDTQKDLMGQLSAMFNAGIRPQDAQSSWDNPIGKSWFIDHKDLFYKAQDAKGNPMYNVYDRAMHAAGWTGYAYDYDDRLGQDGTQVSKLTDHPKFNVLITM